MLNAVFLYAAGYKIAIQLFDRIVYRISVKISERIPDFQHKRILKLIFGRVPDIRSAPIYVIYLRRFTFKLIGGLCHAK